MIKPPSTANRRYPIRPRSALKQTSVLSASAAKVTRSISATGLFSDPSTRPIDGALAVRMLPTPVRWSFLLYVSALPLDVIDLGVMATGFSLPKLFGLVFFACFFFYYSPVSKRSFPPVPDVMWWFLGYIAVYMINGLFISAQFATDFIVRLITLTQLVIFFWVASDLLKNGKLARDALLGYSIVCFIIAIGIILDLPGFSVTTAEGRVAALGENENALAGIMALAALTLIGLRLCRAFGRFVNKCLVALAFPPLVAMIATGSRGVTMAFVIGCLAYLLPNVRFNRRFTATFFAILVVAGGIYMAATKADFVERWYESYYEGKLSGREEIIPAALEMILERPIFGWRPVEFWYELGSRVGISNTMDPHNTFLYLLLEVGVVGSIGVLIGLWLCGRAAWRARTRNLGFLPFSLFLTVVAINASGTGLTTKSFWLVLALALAAASSTADFWRKRSSAFPIRRHT